MSPIAKILLLVRYNLGALIASLILIICVLAISGKALAQDIGEMNNRTVRLYTHGDLKGALTSATEAVTAARTKGVVDLPFMTALGNNADLLRINSRFSEASQLFDEALRRYADLDAPPSEDYASIMNNFGLLALNQGMYQQAADRFLSAISARSRAPSHDSLAIVTTFNNLGDAEVGLGNPNDAIGYYSKAAELGLAATSVGIYADMQIGELQGRLSHFLEAEAAYSAAIRAARAGTPPDYVTIARAQLFIAIGDHILRHYEKAEVDIGEAAKSLALSTDAQPKIAASILGEKGSLLRDLRRFDEARVAYNNALNLLDQREGADLPEKAETENGLGLLDAREGRYTEAETVYKSALRHLHEAGQDDSYTAGAVSTDLGFMLTDSGRLQEATGLLENALNIFNKNHYQTDAGYASLLSNLAINYLQEGRFKEAEGLLLQAAQLDEKLYTSMSSEYAITLVNLGDLYNQEGRWTDTLKVTKEAIVFYQQSGEASPSKANAFHRLGIAETNLNDTDHAVSDLEEARVIAKDLGSAGVIILAGTLTDLAIAYDLRGDTPKAIETYQGITRPKFQSIRE